MKSPTHYEYSDGSANRYVVTQTTLEYIPVKPKESSTGMYSGGEPKSVTITNDQFSEVAGLFETAFQNTSVHITERPKMSGLIISTTGNSSKQGILKPGCEEKKNIEEALKELLQ